MKYSLWCTLFGHQFWALHMRRFLDIEWIEGKVPNDICRRCFLTKEECGVAITNHPSPL